MVTAFYKVFNEADFLKESLTNIYPFVDKIVILEYCLESMRKVILPDRATIHGLSVDGTTEIIKKFPDPENKIEHRPIGFIPCAESVPYQMIVDSIDVGDYAWVIDGDIVYDTDFAEKIKSWIDSDKYDCIWVPEVVFFHDFWHEKHLFFAHHQRVFKKKSKLSFYYPGCFEVHWLDKDSDKPYRYIRKSEGDPMEYKGKLLEELTIQRDEGFAFHYALVRNTQRILEKLLWQYEMIDRVWQNEPARNACNLFRNPLEFKINTHDWFLAHEPQYLTKWESEHPAVMKGNKWYKYHWDEKPINISYAQARKLVNWEGIC